MIRALSTAASGMEAQQTRLDVTANNIANSSTPGFKRNRAEFEEVMVQVEQTPGSVSANGAVSAQIEVGLGVRTAGTARSFAQGDMQQTGNPLDVAIDGAGFIPLRMPSGEIAYTRDGALKLDLEGRLVNREGHPIDAELSIPPEADQISISPNGAVTATVPGDPTPIEAGRIPIVSFPNAGGLTAMGKNLFRETMASGAPLSGPPGDNGTGHFAQGTLELSNVKIVEEMVDLIAGQRAYEVNARVIKAADEMLQQATNIR